VDSEESLRRYFSETPISEDFMRRLVLKVGAFLDEDTGNFIFYDKSGEFSNDVSGITV
jgi:hypothetical protein